MSFVVDERGRLWVLDQVNGRLVRYGANGELEATIPIDRANAQDVAIADDGAIAVLDRYGEGDVALYGENGKLAGTLPLVGEGIEAPGDVTGVFVDGNDVYAESEHGPLVKIGDTSGTPANPRETIPGRPTRDGKAYLKAGITDAKAGRTYVIANERPSEAHLFTREIRFEGVVWHIVLLDTDREGTIYFAAEIQPGAEGTDPNVVVLACLDGATGVPKGSAELPANTLPEESFRDLVVLDEGGVVATLRTEKGVSYTRYDCE
jgi:hypothetical protein